MIAHAWADPSGDLVAPPPDPDVVRYVAKCGDDVIGLVTLLRPSASPSPFRGCWLFGLMVRMRYRGRGVGEALTARVLAQAEAEGAEELLLCVFEDNRPAVNLYRKLGFERVTLPELAEWMATHEQADGRRMIAMAKPLVGGREPRAADTAASE